MRLDTLRLLIEVADTGSIQGAARSTGLSRAHLRRRLEELEEQVGIALLHRDPQGVTLTPAGVVAVEQGRALLEATRSLVSDARSAGHEPAGLVRVWEPIGMPPLLRSQMVLALRSQMPRLRFVVRQIEDPMDCLHEPVEVIVHEGVAPSIESWFSRVIIRRSLCPLASPRYLQTRGTPTSLAELATHDLIHWQRPRQPPNEWPLLGGGSVSVTPWFSSPDIVLVRTLAAEGGGILFGPSQSFPDEPSKEPLVPVLDGLIGGQLSYRASSRHPASADVRIRGVLGEIQKLLDLVPVE